MIKLIFVHIPKTGGQSTGEFLKSVGNIFNPYSILGRRPEQSTELFTDLANLRSEFRSKIDRIPADAEILQDCMHIDMLEGLFPGVPRVTILREPAERVVSAYYHWKKHGFIPADEDIKDFAKRVDQMDVMSHLTSGDLSRFALVGDTNRLDTFIEDLAKLMGVKPPAVTPRVNVGSYDEVTAGVRRSILYRNKNDVALYKDFVEKL